MVLASDGVFTFVPDQVAVDVALQTLIASGSASAAAAAVVELAVRARSNDNITCVVVDLRESAPSHSVDRVSALSSSAARSPVSPSVRASGPASVSALKPRSLQ